VLYKGNFAPTELPEHSVSCADSKTDERASAQDQGSCRQPNELAPERTYVIIICIMTVALEPLPL